MGSISSVPGAFKDNVRTPQVVEQIADQMVRHAAHLVQLKRRTGKYITLALEPEPACFLEKTTETIDYFTNHLYADVAVSALAAKTGLSKPQARDALQRQLGTVYDVCHQAVEFEDVDQSLKDLRANGIPVHKFQIASALRIPNITPE